jgi:hypothetical protein
MGYVDGSFACPEPHIIVSHAGGMHQQPNPAYQHWIQQDQAILSAFVSSMNESIVGMVMFSATTRVAWETLSGVFASTSIARSSGIRKQMAELKKDNKTITVYFHKMKALSDSLTSIGMPLRDEEFISYILAGLGEEYDALYEVVIAHTIPMPIRDLFSQLQSTEARKLAQRRTSSGPLHYPAAHATIHAPHLLLRLGLAVVVLVLHCPLVHHRLRRSPHPPRPGPSPTLDVAVSSASCTEFRAIRRLGATRGLIATFWVLVTMEATPSANLLWQ